MNKWINTFLAVILMSGISLGCTLPKQELQSVSMTTIESMETPFTQSSEEIVVPIQTEIPLLIPPIDFSTDMVFCADEPIGNSFSVTCSDEGLSVFQSPDRRRTDSMLRREITLLSDGFHLSADVVSQPAKMNRLDQNQFGFYFTTTNGKTYALRIEGQYFNFEEWMIADPVEIVDTYNKTYAPAFNSAGRNNNIDFICSTESCDLYCNDVLISRSPFGTLGDIKAVGFFTASNWDQEFGTILLENLSVTELLTIRPETQAFILNDALTTGSGTFTQMGLSGAFSDYEEDGFHFSPVIPYGYYAAKSGPSLANMSVKALISMEFNPGVKATQYAGVVCRSSLDGVYIAVMRADATYTIYRDTVQYPFSLLAQDEIEGIQEGRSENAIRLDCIENNISLYINNIQVESFENTRHGIRFGRAGLFTKAGGAPYSDAIIFRDFSVEEIR